MKLSGNFISSFIVGTYSRWSPELLCVSLLRSAAVLHCAQGLAAHFTGWNFSFDRRAWNHRESEWITSLAVTGLSPRVPQAVTPSTPHRFAVAAAASLCHRLQSLVCGRRDGTAKWTGLLETDLAWRPTGREDGGVVGGVDVAIRVLAAHLGRRQGLRGEKVNAASGPALPVLPAPVAAAAITPTNTPSSPPRTGACARGSRGTLPGVRQGHLPLCPPGLPLHRWGPSPPDPCWCGC